MANKNEKTTIEQYVSKGVTKVVDNIILQKIIKIIEECNIKDNMILTLKLNSCPHSLKQHITVVDESDNVIDDYCELCEKAANTIVLVYQFKDKNVTKRTFYLSYEAEEMIANK